MKNFFTTKNQILNNMIFAKDIMNNMHQNDTIHLLYDLLEANVTRAYNLPIRPYSVKL